jgi:hypothetical protein
MNNLRDGFVAPNVEAIVSGASDTYSAAPWLAEPLGFQTRAHGEVDHSSAVTSRVMLTPEKSRTQGVAMAKGVSAISAQSTAAAIGRLRPSAKPRDCGSATP